MVGTVILFIFDIAMLAVGIVGLFVTTLLSKEANWGDAPELLFVFVALVAYTLSHIVYMGMHVVPVQMRRDAVELASGIPFANDNDKLRASLAAIHFHSGGFSIQNWKLVSAKYLAATLKSIHDECEYAFPELLNIPTGKDNRMCESCRYKQFQDKYAHLIDSNVCLDCSRDPHRVDRWKQEEKSK